MSTPQQIQDSIDERAANWAARLAGAPLSQAERHALTSWLAQASAHPAALAEARAAWALMCRVGAEAKVIDLPRPIRPPAHAARQWLRGAAMAAGILAAALVGLAGWCGDPLTVLAADYHTGTGQIETVTLPDGSVARLGPDSAITIHYDSEVRRVELLSGQADFTAAPRTAAEPRPFEVAAGDGSARALGTRFMVNHLPGAVEVAVAEHTVEVTLFDAGGAIARTLVKPGEKVRYGKASLGPVTAAPFAQAAAWQEGTLVFDRVPLAEVAAILNRYRHGRIVIGDDALAARTVSGVFQTGKPGAALEIIRQTLGVRAAALPPVMTLLY